MRGPLKQQYHQEHNERVPVSTVPGRSFPGTRETNRPLDSLSFLDLIYAVPLAELGTKLAAAELGLVSAAEWANLLVCVSIILFSWIGLHQNRRQMAQGREIRTWISEARFASVRFWQFILEVAILALYFAMILKVDLPEPNKVDTSPNTAWIALMVVIIFAAYLAWDALDVWQADTMRREARRQHKCTVTFRSWKANALRGGKITLVFLMIFSVILVPAFLPPAGYRQYQALVVPILLIIGLYMYRVTQEKCRKQEVVACLAATLTAHSIRPPSQPRLETRGR